MTSSTQKETPQNTPNENISRRALLRRVGTLAGAVAVVSAAPGVLKRAAAQDSTTATDSATATATVPATTSTTPIPGATPTNPFGTLANLSSDVDIFNFALLLEYLEAEFYARVVAANNRRTFLQARPGEVAQKLAADEAAHVTAIINRIRGLGGTPIAKPTFQFPENTFISQFGFLDLAATFEVTGVGAYLGAAPRVRGDESLRFAASIYGIEARHTALIRFVDGRIFAPSALEKPLTPAQIAERVAPFVLV